jgi:hypothetical protein
MPQQHDRLAALAASPQPGLKQIAVAAGWVPSHPGSKPAYLARNPVHSPVHRFRIVAGGLDPNHLC